MDVILANKDRSCKFRAANPDQVETNSNESLEHKPTAPIRNVFSRRGAV